METIIRSPVSIPSAFHRTNPQEPEAPRTGNPDSQHDAREVAVERRSDGPRAMAFHSILFQRPDDSAGAEAAGMPSFFIDLNLDQVVDAITAGREDYDLKPFFYTPLHAVDSIVYRHEVTQDLEDEGLLQRIGSFTERMRTMRAHLAQADKLYYKRQKERWFLEAVTTYCNAVTGLLHDLSLSTLKSRGLLAFQAHLADYIASEHFSSLLAETEKLTADLSAITYCLHIKEGCIRVRRCEGEIDYSADVEKTFEKFKSGTVKSYRVQFPDYPQMNHVEAGVLDRVAQLYPDLFRSLVLRCGPIRLCADPPMAWHMLYLSRRNAGSPTTI